MDLHLLDAESDSAERAAVDSVLGVAVDPLNDPAHRAVTGLREARAGHETRRLRHLLLPSLWAVQARIGWISPGAMNYVCRRLDVAPADAYGVATFYAMLSTEPSPPRTLHVCDDIACRCSGVDELITRLEQRFGPEGSLSADGSSTWHRSPCLGQCDRAPAALVTIAADPPAEQVLVPLRLEDAVSFLDGAEPAVSAAATTVPQQGSSPLRLLRRVGVVDPHSLSDYRAYGGYEALRRAFELGPEGVLRELRDAKLSGRGGAAFPTAVKWEAVARQPVRPHYLVCNADESEPGTFKDRVICEGDPFALIESMTICAVTTGVEQGFIYLRGEYPQAHHALQAAIDAAQAASFLGARVMGHDAAFTIEIRRGAGAYICGEETAIFNSIEGFRGEPRSKPPFPVVSGLFGKPTIVNNVETLVNVLDIVLDGGARFAARGSELSTGPKLFCVCGCVERPGVYEVEFGVTLRSLIDQAGGVRSGRELRAVLLGGAAGSFVTPDALDTPLTLEGARTASATLGSGVVLLIDDTVSMPAILHRIAVFFRDESCGQCVPCRVGTVRQEELLARLAAGTAQGSVATELAMFDELAQCMRDASICGLGQTASSAIGSAITRLGVFAEGSA